MASPTSSSAAPAIPPKYEYLKSLSDIQNTRDLTEDAVRDILRNNTSDHGLEIIEMGPISDMGGLNDAFNSTICSLKIKVRLSGKGEEPAGAVAASTSGEEKEFNFVIKSPPKMTFIKQVHKMSRPFFNEVSWYMDLVPQLELACGKGTINYMLPTCYHAYSSVYADRDGEGTVCTRNCPFFCWVPCKHSEKGVLILENVKLKETSYTMFDKRKPLPLDHIRLIMKELAQFHGKWLKYVYMAKHKQLKSSNGVDPLTHRTFLATYNTQSRIPSFLYKQLKNVARKTVIKILKKMGPEEDEYVDKCKQFFDHSATDMLNEYMNKPPSEVFTLCHGDFWSNNILFSYDDKEAVKDLVIIDYQLLNYGHPAYDLVYFFYLNTDAEFRDAHLNEVLRVYYDNFHPYVNEYSSEGFSYSFEDFISDFNFHKPVGFTTACSVMPNVFSNTQVDLEANGFNALRELQRKQEQELNDDTNPSSIEIRRRIVQLVHEMARDGVI